MGLLDSLFGKKPVFREDGTADVSDMGRVVLEWNRLKAEHDEVDRNWTPLLAGRSSDLRDKMQLLEFACVAHLTLPPVPFSSLEEARAVFAGQDLTQRLRSYDRGAVMALQARLLPRVHDDISAAGQRFLTFAAEPLGTLSDREGSAVRDSVSELNYWFVGQLYERVTLSALGSPVNVFVAQNIRHALIGARCGYLRSNDIQVDRDQVKESADNFADWIGKYITAILEGPSERVTLGALLERMIGSAQSSRLAEATKETWIAVAKDRTGVIAAILKA